MLTVCLKSYVFAALWPGLGTSIKQHRTFLWKPGKKMDLLRLGQQGPLFTLSSPLPGLFLLFLHPNNPDSPACGFKAATAILGH
jgi:hypothetical protein